MLAELLIMFGLSGADHLINSATEDIEADKWGVYQDKNGELRLNTTMKKVFYGHSKNGENVLYYKNGKIAKNIGIDEAKEKENEAIKNGYNFYLRAPMGGSFIEKMGNNDIDGERYCKVNESNDVYYVKRYISLGKPSDDNWYHGSFYMDMNYNLVAPTEECINEDINIWGVTKSECHKKVIEKFNNKDLRSREILSSHLKIFSI